MAKKKDFVTSIAEILPEGLDENLINGISKLVSEKIEDRVSEAKAEIVRKTAAFIRGQIEKLKEHALKELELENETFRNAQMFETVRSMFAVELTGEDEITATTALASIGEQQDQKIDVLVSEMDRILQENTKLKNSLKILLDKNKMLESSVVTLNENVETERTKKSGKIMSDSAVVVSEKNFKVKEQPIKPAGDKIRESTDNEFLDDEVLSKLKVLGNR